MKNPSNFNAHTGAGKVSGSRFMMREYRSQKSSYTFIIKCVTVSIKNSTVQYSIVQYSTLQYNTVRNVLFTIKTSNSVFLSSIAMNSEAKTVTMIFLSVLISSLQPAVCWDQFPVN